jgi:hypothetical protein
MDTTLLKNKIHALVDSSDEEMLQSVYQLLQQTDYTEEFKNMLTIKRIRKLSVKK